jgi:hypothetical protein
VKLGLEVKGKVVRCCTDCDLKVDWYKHRGTAEGYMFEGELMGFAAVQFGAVVGAQGKLEPNIRVMPSTSNVSKEFTVGAGTKLTDKLPACKTSLDGKYDLRVEGEAAAFVGTATLNVPIGKCSVVDGCEWTWDPSLTYKFKVVPRAGISATLKIRGGVTGTINLAE